MRERILDCLRSAVQKPRLARAYLHDAFHGILVLHEDMDAGRSAWRSADAKEFVRLLHESTASIYHLIGMLGYDADVAAEDEVIDILVQRSALQYVFEDFGDELPDGTMSSEQLGDLDEEIAAMAAKHAELIRDSTPRPDSHWWWRQAPEPSE